MRPVHASAHDAKTNASRVVNGGRAFRGPDGVHSVVMKLARHVLKIMDKGRGERIAPGLFCSELVAAIFAPAWWFF